MRPTAPIRSAPLRWRAAGATRTRRPTRRFWAALQDANAFIAEHPREAAQIFARIERTNLPVGFIERLIVDPESSFAPAPQNVMKIYGFMHRVGTLKNMPATWQDLFFPEVHGLKGD